MKKEVIKIMLAVVIAIQVIGCTTVIVNKEHKASVSSIETNTSK